MAEAEAKTYVVDYDPEVTVRVSRALMRREWWKWLSSCLAWSSYFLMFGAVVYAVPHLQAMKHGEGAGAAWLIGLCVALGFVYVFVHASRGLDYAKTAYIGERWTCEVSEGGWSYEDKKGVKAFVPWKEIKIEFEHPEAYAVKAGGQSTLVYRPPLRAAGLDEEFRARVEAANS